MNEESGFSYQLLQDFTWSEFKRENANSKPCDFDPNADEFEWRSSKLSFIKPSIASLILADCCHVSYQNNRRNLDAADANAGTNATRLLAGSG